MFSTMNLTDTLAKWNEPDSTVTLLVNLKLEQFSVDAFQRRAIHG